VVRNAEGAYPPSTGKAEFIAGNCKMSKSQTGAIIASVSGICGEWKQYDAVYTDLPLF